MNKYTTTQGNRRSPRLWALVLVAGSALLLGGCYASSSAGGYQSETAKAIIDSGNNICITLFLSAVMRAIFNK